MSNTIEYMFQKKQLERDIEYIMKTYDFDEIDAIKILIEKYQLRIEAANNLIITKGGKV